MLCAFLSYTALGTKYKQISHLLDMSESMVGVICVRVAETMLRLYDEEIRLPTAEEVRASAETYRVRHGLPGCVGAIDGSHIPCKYV